MKITIFRRTCIGVAAAATLSLPTITQAQSSVTLYGVVDTGLEFLTNANKTDHSLVQMQSGNIQGPRWGIRAKEDIGNGWFVQAWLENGFDSSKGTSSQGGRMFGRQSAVGVSGHDNELWLGRVYNPMYFEVNPFDPTIYAQYSLGSLDAGLVDRGDQSIRYVRTLGDFKITGFYSFGVDSVGTPVGGNAGGASTAKDIAAALTYTGNVFGGVLAYDNLHGPVSAAATAMSTAAPGLIPKVSSPGDRVRRYVAAASVTVGDATLMAGYRRLEDRFVASSLNSNLYWGGARVKVTPALNLLGGVYHLDVLGQNVKATDTVLSAEYFLSKSTYLYTNASYMFNSKNSSAGVDLNGVTLAGKNQFGLQAGLTKRF